MDESTKLNEEREESRTTAIHAVLSFAIALGLLFVGIAAIIIFVLTKPEAQKKEGRELVPTVRVQPLEIGDHDVRILTQGEVSSLREVALAAEVGGRVMSIAPELVMGGTVEAKQVLVVIDPADYKAAVSRAMSALADAKVALDQEQALAEQAVVDWKTLGRGEPNDLVLRKPQIAAAIARIDSAKTEVALANRNLERATIRAPFDARVRAVQVEVGSVVAPGSLVAELYSAGELEVRLPFSLQDFGFLNTEQAEFPEFMFTATIGGESVAWPAKLVRLEGEVDRATLSGYGIAKVSRNDSGRLPPVGLFVEAVVPGMSLENVVQLPRVAVRGRNDVWVVADGKLQKRHVRILRSGRENLVVRGDFDAGDQLVITRLAAPLVGMKVEVEQAEGSEIKE